MLVLARKIREAVVVGGVDGFSRLLKVTVLEISHGKVKLGFDVDADVPVHRLEVWERIQAEGGADIAASRSVSRRRDSEKHTAAGPKWLAAD